MAPSVILATAPVGKNHRKVTLSVGEGSNSYTVPESLWNALGAPGEGTELPEETVSRMIAADGERRACQAAVRILASGDNNRRTLAGKLFRRGFTREASVAAVRRMVALGYIREDEQTKRLAADMVSRKLYGPERIRAELLACGYANAEIEGALAEVEGDFPAARRALLTRAGAEGKSPPQTRALLARHGFSGGEFN